MKTSQAGIDLIKRFEGLKLYAYQDSVGVWTIGYGHTVGVSYGDKWTVDKAESELAKDLVIYEAGVKAGVSVDICQHHFDALVSFAFNLGVRALHGSTLLRKINAGDNKAAALEFGRWVYAGGVRLKGLERRREAERALFTG